MVNQLVRAGRLDRSFYTNLLFDDYASGNAVAIMALLAAVPVLIRTLSPILAVSLALRALIRGFLVALAAWAVATRMFGRDGRIQTTVRLTGYAHVALTPLIATLFVPGLLFPLLAISLVWFFLSMRLVGEVQFDLPPGDAQMVGAAAAGAMLILLLIMPLF